MRALNPVLRRELTERWRGRRAFVLLTVYVAVLAAIVLVLYWLGHTLVTPFGDTGGVPGRGGGAGPMIGRFLFENLLAVVLLLVLFITPGYAAAQISGERERRSLPLLQVTLLRPLDIVAGKLGAATAWMVLLVLVALPFAATAFFLGGVTVGDLLRSGAYLVGLSVAVAAIGIGVSSLTRRTTASVVVTYGLILFLLVGSLVGTAVELVVRSRPADPVPPPRPLTIYANPFFGLSDATGTSSLHLGANLPSVLTPFAFALPESPAFADRGGPEQLAPMLDPDARGSVGEPVWLVSLAVFGAAGAAGVAVASRRLRPGATRARPVPDAGDDGGAPPQGPWERPRGDTSPPP